MRSVRMRSGTTLLGLPSLFFIYLLLGILGTVFASAFFAETLSGGKGVMPLVRVVFFSIPLILSGFLLVSLVRLVSDVLNRRGGGRLKARLLAYFFAVSVLSSFPSLAIASRFVSGISDSWFTADLEKALGDANWFAMEAYRQRLESLERTAKSDFTDRMARAYEAGKHKEAGAILVAAEAPIVSVQSFSRKDWGVWVEDMFVGDRAYALRRLPAETTGFLPRDLVPTRENQDGRDRDVIRYLAAKGEDTVRLLTMSLGEDFDIRTARLSAAIDRVGAVRAIRQELAKTLTLLFAVFLLPSLLMTLLITFSLTNAVTQPLMSLTDATKRVAEGDFSIRILERPGDELGTLVASFNAMVRELENSRTALLRTEKINVWQDIAQRLAHEIKNPLTPIKLSAERVLRRSRTDPENLNEIVESCMLAIIQEVDGLSNLLSDFRSFARMPPPSLESTPVRSVLQDTVALYRSSYPGVDFDLSGVDGEMQVQADKRYLSQVITNLIVNAVDAMGGKGRMEFRTELVKKKDTLYCRISFRDNGKGIPEEARPHIFTPYFTTKETGTGLGLPIVERIVDDHGGAIWFDTAVGVGTTFYIDLPVRN